MATKPSNGKKNVLKKLIKKSVSSGASPFNKLDGGLGNMPLSPSGDAITGGGGSNLGTNGVF